MKVIEIGGGDNPQYRPNLDIRSGSKVDIVTDLNQKLPLQDNSYEYVYSAFAIEHISWRSIPLFLAEIHRILEPNGHCTFITANLLEQCRKAVETPEWDENIPGMLFGGQDYPENTHRCGFSPEYAFKIFRVAGFSGVTVRPLPQCRTDMIIEARK
jgi:ubiquinone/menaquinone biosynthesis C-methylase UbiE